MRVVLSGGDGMKASWQDWLDIDAAGLRVSRLLGDQDWQREHQHHPGELEGSLPGVAASIQDHHCRPLPTMYYGSLQPGKGKTTIIFTFKNIFYLVQKNKISDVLIQFLPYIHI